MERTIFPAVAGELAERFVEARLHVDHAELGARNKALQKELVGAIALPSYVILDPETSRKLAVHKGWIPDKERFLEFLRMP